MKNKMIFLDTILLFLLMFLSHNMYTWFPNDFISIFFPVNESIWEHMKMIYTTIIFYGFIKYIILNRKTNLLLALYLSSIITIIIELILFIPIYSIIGENLPITLITLIISIFIGQFFFSKFSKTDLSRYIILALILIIITFILMGYLTYNPPYNYLFFDPIEKKYGLNTYVI